MVYEEANQRNTTLPTCLTEQWRSRRREHAGNCVRLAPVESATRSMKKKSLIVMKMQSALAAGVLKRRYGAAGIRGGG